MPEMTQPISKDRVPFFSLCENPQVWADDFLKAEAAEADFKRLKTEYEQIRKMPRAKADQIKLLRQAYEDHNKNISKELTAMLSAFGPGAFGRLPHTPNSPINSFIPKDIFEAALDQLPPDPPDAITDDQKKKELNTIQKKMDSLKYKIKKFSPQSYFQLKNGSVQCDSRREFVEFWRNKQAYVMRPCNAQGLDLELATDDERWLFKKLKIGAYILDKARKLPYRP